VSDAPLRRSPLLKFAIALAFGLAGAALFDFSAPRGLELFVELERPAGLALPRRLDLRFTRAEGGTEVARQRRERVGEAATLVVPLRLPRGRYRVEAWPADPGGAPGGRWEAEFDVAGRTDVPVTCLRVP